MPPTCPTLNHQGNKPHVAPPAMSVPPREALEGAPSQSPSTLQPPADQDLTNRKTQNTRPSHLWAHQGPPASPRVTGGLARVQ